MMSTPEYKWSTTDNGLSIPDNGTVVTENPWFPLIVDHRHEIKIFYGGRGGGKTHAFASAIPRLMDRNDWPTGKPLRICVMREVWKSIEKSCKSTIEDKIKTLGLSHQFRGSTKYELKHENGAICFFQGMSNVTDDSVRGLESVDILWFEEAQAMSQRSWTLLEPTIRRDHSEIWMSFNPENRTDAVWELKEFFEEHPHKDILVFQVNYDRNIFFTERNNRKRLRDKKRKPEMYAYVWLGEPNDGATARKLLPHGDLMKVVKKQDTSGYVYAGLDIADTGRDKNALVIRQGNTIIYHDSWGGVRINDTVRRAVKICTEMGVDMMFFDETGLGAGAGSTLNDMKREKKIGFKYQGINFGSAVRSPKQIWGMQGDRAVRQTDRYERRTAQMGDTIRMRLHASLARMNGNTKVPAGACLWIQPGVKKLRQLMVQMAQPEERESVAGKMVIEKQPKPEGSTNEPPSPDSYDAAILAFATDSNFGVQRKNWYAA